MNSPAPIKKVTPRIYFLTALFVVLALWGWWAVENYTDFRLSKRASGSREDPVDLWFPLVATPLAFLIAFWNWRRAIGISENGMVVDATIEKFGRRLEGAQDATVVYTVEGKTYKKKKGFNEDLFATRGVGDVIQIVVDRRNPKRFIVQDQSPQKLAE
jgi:hypothetical protein